jgi:ethanolamine permease
MSITNKRKIPHVALYAGTILGFATMMILWYLLGSEKGGAIIGSTLLNMAVFGAMISYAMQGLSFIVLRKKLPNIIRPYRSPVGVFGASVTIVIALITLWYQLQDPVYQKAVLAVAAFYVLGILYFAIYGRNQLILSPEEEFALSKGAKAHD